MNGYVYFVQRGEDGPIKIGYSSQPLQRFQQIQTASAEVVRLLGNIEGDEEKERSLHKKFSQFRIKGEWFAPDAELIEQINQILTQFAVEANEPIKEPDDPYTARARAWMTTIEDTTALRLSVTVFRAREIVAGELGIALGTFENMRRGRVGPITVKLYEAVRNKYIEVLKIELAALKAQLADQLSVNQDCEGLLRAADQLAAARQVFDEAVK